MRRLLIGFLISHILLFTFHNTVQGSAAAIKLENGIFYSSLPAIPWYSKNFDMAAKEIAAKIDTTTDSCSGSSGDPIVKITFGSGNNFGIPLGPSITNLMYTTINNGCPGDGFYTITNLSTNCFGGNWHITRDHTGDNQGYFMLINASYTPNDFYVKQVDGLCSGTSFEFSSYVMNMNNFNQGARILPNITFQIEDLGGKVLAKYKTNDIPQTSQPLWVKYGFNFKTPPGVNSVILRLTNNAPGGNGNDLGLDDISFRPIGPRITTQVSIGSSDSITLCLGNPQTPKILNFSSKIQKCFPNPDYQWQMSKDLGITWSDISGAITPSYVFPVIDTGQFYIRLAASQKGNIYNPNCRFVSQITKIGIYNVVSPKIQIVSSAMGVCTGTPIQFTAQSTFPGKAPIYEWFLNGAKVGTNSSNLSLIPQNPIDSIYCRLTSSLPCSNPVVSNTLNFRVFPYPQIQLIPIFIIKNGKSILLNPVIQGDNPTYSWTPSAGLSDPTAAQPLASPINTTTYTLQVQSINGCVDTAKTTVFVIYDLDIPNIFSPNGDGINDIWNIGHLTDFTHNTVDIFNRYGFSVFHSDGYGIPWDGKLNGMPLPVATYYYVINPHFGTKIFTGTVTIIR